MLLYVFTNPLDIFIAPVFFPNLFCHIKQLIPFFSSEIHFVNSQNFCNCFNALLWINEGSTLKKVNA